MCGYLAIQVRYILELVSQKQMVSNNVHIALLNIVLIAQGQNHLPAACAYWDLLPSFECLRRSKAARLEASTSPSLKHSAIVRNPATDLGWMLSSTSELPFVSVSRRVLVRETVHVKMRSTYRLVII